MKPEDKEHLDSVLRHIDKVDANCRLLGARLIGEGKEITGLRLIGNGLVHDRSKIVNEVEWLYLRTIFKGKPEFQLAYRSHVTTNLHHPEAHDSIHDMSDVYLAEFVCDTFARANEFGTDFKDWQKTVASKQYGFSLQSATYKKIKTFTNLLLEEPFK